MFGVLVHDRLVARFLRAGDPHHRVPVPGRERLLVRNTLELELELVMVSRVAKCAHPYCR